MVVREDVAEGDVIVRGEGARTTGEPGSEPPVVVVHDEPKLLATYIAEGTPFHFPGRRLAAHDGSHPWHGRGPLGRPGVLMLQRPGDAHAIWVFWHGPRASSGWYVNLQEPFRRTETGYDTQDSSSTSGCRSAGVGVEGRDVLEDASAKADTPRSRSRRLLGPRGGASSRNSRQAAAGGTRGGRAGSRTRPGRGGGSEPRKAI